MHALWSESGLENWPEVFTGEFTWRCRSLLPVKRWVIAGPHARDLGGRVWTGARAVHIDSAARRCPLHSSIRTPTCRAVVDCRPSPLWVHGHQHTAVDAIGWANVSTQQALSCTSQSHKGLPRSADGLVRCSVNVTLWRWMPCQWTVTVSDGSVNKNWRQRIWQRETGSKEVVAVARQQIYEIRVDRFQHQLRNHWILKGAFTFQFDLRVYF